LLQLQLPLWRRRLCLTQALLNAAVAETAEAVEVAAVTVAEEAAVAAPEQAVVVEVGLA
jgi:hypothetical protein